MAEDAVDNARIKPRPMPKPRLTAGALLGRCIGGDLSLLFYSSSLGDATKPLDPSCDDGEDDYDSCDNGGDGDDECEKQAQADEEMRRTMTAQGTGARARCWESVQYRYGACITGKPIPPLILH